MKKTKSNIIIHLCNNYMFDLIGGPKIIKARYIANFYKGATFIYIIILMNIFQNFSYASFLYLSLHGSYGILWLIKDLVFPDKNFDNKMTIFSMIGGLGILNLYWLLDYIEISGYGIENPTYLRICVAITVYLFGTVIMLLSDCQKYFTLKYKKGLISDGMFYCNRNPNYFGEILIYGSFCIMIGNWICWGLCIFIWITVFNLNVYLKDETSLKYKDGWDSYQSRSGRILFKIFKNKTLNFGVYGLFGGLIYYFYINI